MTGPHLLSVPTHLYQHNCSPCFRLLLIVAWLWPFTSFRGPVFSGKHQCGSSGKEVLCQGSSLIFCGENWGQSHRRPASTSKTQKSVGSGSGENCNRAGLWLAEGLHRPRWAPENMLKNQGVIVLYPCVYPSWLLAEPASEAWEVTTTLHSFLLP